MWNKMEFLPSCGCASTAVWMHHLDANKMHGATQGCSMFFWTNPENPQNLPSHKLSL